MMIYDMSVKRSIIKNVFNNFVRKINYSEFYTQF